MTLRASHRPLHDNGGWIGPPPDAPSAHPANRRRLLVFLATLIVALGASITVVWLRPAEYRATARVEITPATTTAPNAASAQVISTEPESARPFLTEVQILTSRPVLEEVASRLERIGQNTSLFGADPIAGMQSHLDVLPITKTNVVELTATGSDADILAPLLNSTIDVYRDRLAKSYQSSSTEAMSEADEEVRKLEATVAAKRRDLEAFRIRHNIVSLERNENDVLAQVRNLSTSLGAANEKVAIAEGKVRALTESAAAGNTIARSRDDPTLASMELRASQAREELRDMERTYTQDYLAKEPKAIGLRARLAELERQIVAQRETSQKAALAEAQEELASATGTAARLQGQVASGRAEVGQFTGRYNEYKARQDDLTELEKTFREATQKRARLEASERSRMPVARIIEAASTPREPWRPLYWRDTGIAAGASLVLALLVMWLVELFNRTAPQPAVVLVRQQAGGMSYDGRVEALSLHGAQNARLVDRADTPLLAAQPALPRELERNEVAGLLQAADDSTRHVVALLLSGATVEDAIAERSAIGNSDPRLAQGGRAATRESIDAQILCAAHDAGLADPAEVNAACLRHTYVAYLVRQGIRFADLTSLVGELPAELLGAYTTFAPPGPRVPRERIETSYPGVSSHVAG